MDTSINNKLYSYSNYQTQNNSYVKNTKSIEDGTTNSKTETNSMNTIDKIELTNTSSNNGFFKIVNELSSEEGTMQGEDCTVSYSEAFFVARLIMEDNGCNVPSLDGNYSNYSKFVEEMKNFFSDRPSSFSTGICDFCDILQNRLNQYGIS